MGEKTKNGTLRVCVFAVVCFLAEIMRPGKRDLAQRKNVFIGDSRTVGMYLYAKNASQRNTVRARDDRGDVWCASVGQGYHWMVNSGVPWAEKYVDANTNVIILVGFNDVSMQSWNDLYIDFINAKAWEWKCKGARCYFVSIGPAREDHGNITNAGIAARNAELYAGLNDNVTYINVYDFIQQNAVYMDPDHFTPDFSRLYYSYLINVLENDEAMIAYFDAAGASCQGCPCQTAPVAAP